MNAKSLKALAVTTKYRSKIMPELPTMDEAGVPGYEIIGWNGIHVPLKTPPELINKLNADLRQALQSPEVQERLTAASLDIHGFTRAEFEGLIRPLVERSLDRCKAALRDASLKPAQVDEVVLVGGSTRGETATLRLALAVQGVDREHADVPDLLDRLLDLGLVRTRVHEERVDVALDARVGLLRHDRADDDVAGRLHATAPSPVMTSSAACVKTTRSAAMTS